jgi:hypothetical protein
MLENRIGAPFNAQDRAFSLIGRQSDGLPWLTLACTL